MPGREWNRPARKETVLTPTPRLTCLHAHRLPRRERMLLGDHQRARFGEHDRPGRDVGFGDGEFGELKIDSTRTHPTEGIGQLDLFDVDDGVR